MSKTIIFHCRMPVRDCEGNLKLKSNGRVQTMQPTHTLAFHKVMDEDTTMPTVVMGWAVANTKHDDYNRKFGSELAKQRAGDLLNRVYNFPNRTNYYVSEITMDIVPAVVAKNNLNYYLSHAIKSIYIDRVPPAVVKIVFYSTMEHNSICEYLYTVEI
jgi:hypothetical protein